MPRPARPVLARFSLAALAALALAGCATTTAYDKLANTKPSGPPFAQALFHDYSDLAHSFGMADTPSATAFGATEAYSLSGLSPEVAAVADAYAAKAMTAAEGQEPLPEAAPPDSDMGENARLKLLRALDQGRKRAPAIAARAQAEYDCWVMNSPVPKLAASARHCYHAFTTALARLESALNMAPSQPAASKTETASKAETPAKPAATFTAHFALGSARLDRTAMGVLRQAIEAAYKGRQSRITVVGHTDTSGTEALNKALSLNRAKAVKAALVRMGARPAAVQISGVGESDLAVETPDGVPNAQNRRAVVTLLP
jgi:outer membrane protein OmpA-like peptidoglycan-associated protein